MSIAGFETAFNEILFDKIKFYIILEVVSKPHLMSDSCVASLFKMLTYFNVCCAFSSACALLSNMI